MTHQEVLDVLAEIGKSITVLKSKHDTCKTFVSLSNGWTLEVFDECCSEWDYLEAVIAGGERFDLWEPPYEDNQAWDPVRYWTPTEAQLRLMDLS